MTTSPFRSAAALLTAAVLTLTGCAADADPTSSSATPSTGSSSEPAESTETAKAKPAKSEPAIKNRGERPFQEVSGVVSWEVQPGKGLTTAQAKKVSAAADAFINEHLLRPDRWQGKYVVKTGEMDEVKSKYTPYMYGLVAPDISWWHANAEEYGHAPDNWPKKQRAMASKKARGIGGMFVTQTLTDGGKGPIENEVTRRVVYWGGTHVMAYIEVTGFRVNNTGTRESITATLTFKKADGRWLIDGVHWDII